jgi:hypothetical protein
MGMKGTPADLAADFIILLIITLKIHDNLDFALIWQLGQKSFFYESMIHHGYSIATVTGA